MADEDEVVEMAEEVEEEVAEMNVLDALKEVRFCHHLKTSARYNVLVTTRGVVLYSSHHPLLLSSRS